MGTGTIRKGLRAVGLDGAADAIDRVLGPAGESGKKLGKKTGEEEAYDIEKARLEETKRINDALREYTKSLEIPADNLEKKCLKICREYIELLMEDIKKINQQPFQGKKLNINITRLDRELRSIEKRVSGMVKEKLSKKISLDDEQCREILKMQKGQAKEQRMKNYADYVFRDALNDMTDAIREVTTSQFEYISDVMEERLEDITASMKELEEQFQEIESIKQQDENQIEEKMCGMYLQLSICETVLQELKN